MTGVYKNKSYLLNSFINLLIIFLSFNNSFSNLLNNIIKFGDKNLRYCHFSFNSNGDMIVDSSSFPVNRTRKFFGLKNNGRFYFNDTNNKETAFYTLQADHSKGRIEGESHFIKLTSSNNKFHGRELILGISKNADSDSGYYTEIYNLKNKNMTKYLTKNTFGNIISDSFTILKTPEELNSKYYYTITYVIRDNSNNYIINLKKAYFSFELSGGIKHDNEMSINVLAQRIVSSFYTKKSIFICFYLSQSYNLRVRAYNSDFSDSVRSNVYETNTYEERNFFKGIHLKGEIGFFIYFKVNVKYPTISILQCNDDKTMTPYSKFEGININKSTFNKDCSLNDIIKLNDFQVSYISTSEDKNYFKIVIFILYKNDTLMNIRYYQIEMFNTYKTKIFLEIKAALYKNFISLAFSNCPEKDCSLAYSHLHYASLVIFSYPNSTDSDLDIIQQLYLSNKQIENDFSFNFEGKITIENNLFGFVFKGTRIMKYPTGLKLRNITNGNILETESILLKNENASLYFEAHENYIQNKYVIEYAYVLEEPNYEDIHNYISDIEDNYGNKKSDEKNYYQKLEYTGKSSDFTIIINEDLITSCNDNSCSLCVKNYTCITCKYNYTINNNIKTCLPGNYILPILTIIPTIIPIQQPETTIPVIATTYYNNLDECSENEILEGKCSGKMTNEQINIIYNKLKGTISSDSNEIIETENVKFQISTCEEQKNNNNPNLSSIDLGECEKLLKKQEGLSDTDNLIILKMDIKSEDLTSTFVQYEIYNPRTLNLINLDICSNSPISVNVPVTLDENTKSIYDSLTHAGYNLFDLNDSFYNDVCTTYTSEDGTDLTLNDRKNLIYNNNANISMCQNGCTFQFYNLTTKKAKCDCSVQKLEIITDTTKINFDKNVLVNSFFSTLKNSNFLILKCYKLVFSKEGQTYNIGSYMMSAITFIFIILMLIYLINGNKKIIFYVEKILKQKINDKARNSLISNKPINKRKNKMIIVTKNNIYNNSTKEMLKLKNSLKMKKNLNKNSIQKTLKKCLKKSKINKNAPPKKQMNLITLNNDTFKKSWDTLMSLPNKKQIKTFSKNNLLKIKKRKKLLPNQKDNKVSEKNKNINKIINKKMLTEQSNKNLFQKNNNNNLEQNKIKDLNDEELNSLEYEIAIIIDKRTFFHYYYSLIRKKHLIFFAFYPANDYNLIAVKISLLFLSFSLFFTINGFFFSDETMRKINEDKGSFDFIFQIPQLLYSTIISTIINMILKRLSLSEKEILVIKLEKDFLIAQKKSKKIKNCLKIKLSIFFILSFILMIFFWYFISCFCAVYKNTQIILIEDTLISFALSMVYPFGLNLLPGIFRIPALRAKKKDKKCLYKASGLIALIL